MGNCRDEICNNSVDYLILNLSVMQLQWFTFGTFCVKFKVYTLLRSYGNEDNVTLMTLRHHIDKHLSKKGRSNLMQAYFIFVF